MGGAGTIAVEGRGIFDRPSAAGKLEGLARVLRKEQVPGTGVEGGEILNHLAGGRQHAALDRDLGGQLRPPPDRLDPDQGLVLVVACGDNGAHKGDSRVRHRV